LLRHGRPAARRPPDVVDPERQARWLACLAHRLTPGQALDLVADYGVPAVSSLGVSDVDAAEAAAAAMGYPVVLKTAAPDVRHKVDVGGVHTGVADAAGVRAAYADLSARLGPDVLVQQQVPAGLELSLGVWRDPLLGPLVMAAGGGTLVELLRERAVALPPLTEDTAARLLTTLPIGTLLDGYRGSARLDRAAVVASLVGLGQLAHELGDAVEAVDVNPLIVTADGAVAVDALIIPRH
ncbi:MAG: acetate--CoA ligase family protein, partial [Nocardioidaceae bacterium]